MTIMYVIGTGPSELRAHIDLDRRFQALDPPGQGHGTRILGVANHGRHWSVIAEITPAGEGQ